MDRNKLRRFKKLFEIDRENLMYTQSILNRELEIQKDDLVDEADLTAAERDQSVKIRLRNRETRYLKKVNEALKRIKEGIFGLCIACEEEIDVKRLEARPTTTHCLQCKENQEKREREFAGGRVMASNGLKTMIHN